MLKGVFALAIWLACAKASAGMGPLDGVITTEQDQSWRVSPAGNGWQFQNAQERGAIRYYYVNEQPGEGGRRTISLDVQVQGSPDSLAGLLYAFQDQPRSYYLFTLSGDNTVNLHHFDNGNFEQKMQLGIDGVGGTVTLTIQEHGQEIALLVNGREKSRIGNSNMGRGGVGVVAVHTGNFLLENFSVTTSRAAASQRSISSDPSDTPRQRRTMPAAANNEQGALHVRRVELRDDSHPRGADTVFSTLIPKDWKTEGGVNWATVNGCLGMPTLGWSASSPDQQHSITILPSFSWGWTTSRAPHRGCFNADIRDAEQAVRFMLQNAPKVRSEVLAVERPAELEPIRKMLEQQILATNPVAQMWVDLAVLKVRTDDGAIKADSYVLVISNHWFGAAPDGWGGQQQSGGGNVALMIAIGTEQDKLDVAHPALNMILSNMQWNQKWQRKTGMYLAQVRGERYKERQNAFEISQQIAKSRSSWLDSAHNSFRERSASSDRMQAELNEAVWETETYSTSEGDRAFSAMYKHVWELNDGSFVLTNDEFYQPFRDDGIDGSRLRPNR